MVTCLSQVTLLLIMGLFSKLLSAVHSVAGVSLALCLCATVQADAGNFAQRAVAAGDTRGKSFAVIDKFAATITLYNASGNLMAASPVLLGLAKGDITVPGIGDRPIRDIAPHERTTPAGRFESEPGKNLSGETVVWIDYDAAVSLHALRPSDPLENRAARMSTASPLDNRITYGCVNVPAEFFKQWVLPAFGKSAGVIYVLPEAKPAKRYFSF